MIHQHRTRLCCHRGSFHIVRVTSRALLCANAAGCEQQTRRGAARSTMGSAASTPTQRAGRKSGLFGNVRRKRFGARVGVIGDTGAYGTPSILTECVKQYGTILLTMADLACWRFASARLLHDCPRLCLIRIDSQCLRVTCTMATCPCKHPTFTPAGIT